MYFGERVEISQICPKVDCKPRIADLAHDVEDGDVLDAERGVLKR